MNRTEIITTQQTSKKWKLLRVVGLLGIIAAVVWLLLAVTTDAPTAGAWVLMIGSGLVVWVARLGKWWCHS